jgi:hypothetical protein
VYSKALNGDDSRVTMPLYVDDGRLYWDLTPAACEAVSADKLRLKERFGIEFGEDDPASNYFLGANRQSSRRDGSKSSATSYIDLMVKRYSQFRALRKQAIFGMPSFLSSKSPKRGLFSGFLSSKSPKYGGFLIYPRKSMVMFLNVGVS